MFTRDFYEEKGVVAKPNTKGTIVMWGLFVVAVLGIVATVLFAAWFPLVITLTTGWAFISMIRNRYVEYDYCFFNEEIEVGKIVNRRRRRTAISFSTSNIRFVAPENSIRVSNHLEQFPGIRVTDYTSKEPTDSVYAFALDLQGINTIIYLEPTENMINHLKEMIPDKILAE